MAQDQSGLKNNFVIVTVVTEEIKNKMSTHLIADDPKQTTAIAQSCETEFVQKSGGYRRDPNCSIKR